MLSTVSACAAAGTTAGARALLIAAGCAVLAAAAAGARRAVARRRGAPGAAGDAYGDARAVRAQDDGAAGADRDGTTGAGRHASRDAALWRLRTTVADAPGALARVCTALAASSVDIVTLQTHPLAQATVDEFLLRAPARLAADALASAVAQAGGRDVRLERADAHDLVDPPTQALVLAARTARDPAELPLALRQLLGRCTVRHTPRHAPDDDGDGPTADGPSPEVRIQGGRVQEVRAQDSPVQGGRTPNGRTADGSRGDALTATVMRLRDPSGGVLTLRRDHLPFTPAEFARARALIALDAQIGPRVPAGRTALAVPGSGFTVRRAGPDDLAAALALHARCSPGTLARRYHGPVADADRHLRHLLGPRFGRSLAVDTPEGRTVALGHLLWDGDESEVALLVEDAWQGRGIGAALLRGLLELAAEAGREAVYAVTGAGNAPMVAAMRSLGLPLDHHVEDGTLVLTAPLPRAADAGSPSVAALPWVAACRR